MKRYTIDEKEKKNPQSTQIDHLTYAVAVWYNFSGYLQSNGIEFSMYIDEQKIKA